MAQSVQMQPVPGGPAAQPLLQGQWMPIPGSIPGCPPGLERLTLVDKVIVQQKASLLEAVTSWEQRNCYDIRNMGGQQIFTASEESHVCMRQCCGNRRGFIMHVMDNNGQEVIKVKRHFKCCACFQCFACIGCCAHEVEIFSPPSVTIGYIKQTCSCWSPGFTVLNENHEVIFKIDGPCCMCQTMCCRCDIEFDVKSPDGNEVGKVSKKWSGITRELFTNADTFGVSFPIDLDVKSKAALIGAVFLIDFMFFESENKKTTPH